MTSRPRLSVMLLWSVAVAPAVGILLSTVGTLVWLDPIALLFGTPLSLLICPAIGLFVGCIAWAGARLLSPLPWARPAEPVAAALASALVAAVAMARVASSVEFIVVVAACAVTGGGSAVLEQWRRPAAPRPLRRGLILSAIALMLGVGDGALLMTAAGAFDTGGSLLDPACRSLSDTASVLSTRDFPPRTLCLDGGTVYSTVAPWFDATIVALLAIVAFAFVALIALILLGSRAFLGRAPAPRRPSSSAVTGAVVLLFALACGAVASAVPAAPPSVQDALFGSPRGFYALNASDGQPSQADSRPQSVPTPPPLTPQPLPTPAHSPVPAPSEAASPRSTLTSEQLREGVDSLVQRTLLAVKAKGPVTIDITSGTSDAAADTTCDGGGTEYDYTALVENVAAPDTNQALYDRIAATWTSAGYPSQGKALVAEYFGAPAGTSPEPPASELSLFGSSEGVTFTIETLCSAD